MPDPVRRLHSRRRTVDRRLPTRWRWLLVRLERADITANEWVRIVSLGAAMVPIGATVGIIVHPAAGAVVASGAPIVPAAVMVRWRRRRSLRLVERMPAALDQMVRLLRAGRTPRESIERTADQAKGLVGTRLQRVADALRLGADPDRALSALSEHDDPRSMARVAVVLRLALHDGGGAADAIEGLAASLRSDHASRARVQMLTAQARLSVRTLTALPVVFVALGALAGSPQTSTLVTTDTGRLCAVVGVALLAVGHTWMLLLVHRIDR